MRAPKIHRTLAIARSTLEPRGRHRPGKQSPRQIFHWMSYKLRDRPLSQAGRVEQHQGYRLRSCWIVDFSPMPDRGEAARLHALRNALHKDGFLGDDLGAWPSAR